MSTAPTFTVLLPVHRGPEMLPFAVESVLSQRRRDFELLVICDGAPPETGQCARRFAEADPRVQVFDLAKGERHGELHRDNALSTARGLYVAHISDDDLWFPDHLDEVERLLKYSDFGNLTQTEVLSDGRLVPYANDLSHKPTVDRMLRQDFNFFGPTVAAYRLDAYRRLDERWFPAPLGIWTDLYMWRKFIRAPHVRIATRHVITSLTFATPARLAWSMTDRRAEVERYAALVKTAAGRARMCTNALRNAAYRMSDQQFELIALRQKRYVRRAAGAIRRSLRRLFKRKD